MAQITKAGQITFGMVLVAIIAISFWEQITDSRLLRSTTYGIIENETKFTSLDAYMDKFDQGELETWDMEDGGLTEKEIQAMFEDDLPDDMLEDDDMFGDELAYGQDMGEDVQDLNSGISASEDAGETQPEATDETKEAAADMEADP
eukprot:CAMPEP_0114247616 /NCGR_PEP_ID=MMETSP0058-20121206/13119_1 /TAXON_ID=36894 /ORGANISM="Pyramimonas parkeae, CCMP726" /LENGTH=146 /DNA_ID=CAMNT_0001360937 /DNA_START=65 /DNA_END=505 /DNA_ORIENTATION=+